MRKLILTALIITLAGLSLFIALGFNAEPPSSGYSYNSYNSRNADYRDDGDNLTQNDGETEVVELNMAEIDINQNTPNLQENPEISENSEIAETAETAQLPEITIIRQADEIDPTKPMLALTFDDGPSRHTTRILDALERHNARATFCVVGIYIEEGRDTISRAADLGCEIIAHSWAHDDLTKLSYEQVRSDLLRTNTAIEGVIGSQSMIFRPPYGNVNETVKSAARDTGFAIMTWCVDPEDWAANRTADEIYAAVLDGAENRAVILSHDRVEATAIAMERLIPELIAQGYQLVTVSELMAYSDMAVEAGVVYRSARGGSY